MMAHVRACLHNRSISGRSAGVSSSVRFDSRSAARNRRSKTGAWARPQPGRHVEQRRPIELVRRAGGEAVHQRHADAVVGEVALEVLLLLDRPMGIGVLPQRVVESARGGLGELAGRLGCRIGHRREGSDHGLGGGQVRETPQRPVHGIARPASPQVASAGGDRLWAFAYAVAGGRVGTGNGGGSASVRSARLGARTLFPRLYGRAPVAQRIEHLTTDQKVRGSNPFGRAPLTSTNTNQRTRSLTMWTESGPRANTSLGNPPADVSAVPSRGPNRGQTLSRMSGSAERHADQGGPASTARHRRRMTFRQMPLAEPSAQSMPHLRLSGAPCHLTWLRLVLGKR